jgi:hypothetical protein
MLMLYCVELWTPKLGKASYQNLHPAKPTAAWQKLAKVKKKPAAWQKLAKVKKKPAAWQKLAKVKKKPAASWQKLFEQLKKVKAAGRHKLAKQKKPADRFSRKKRGRSDVNEGSAE